MKIDYDDILKSVLLGASTKEAAEKIIAELEKHEIEYSFPISYHISNSRWFGCSLAEYLGFVLSENQEQIKWKSRRRVNREEGGDIIQIYSGDPEDPRAARRAPHRQRWMFEFNCDPDDDTDRILKRELNRIAKAATSIKGWLKP
jgi:hypothetical protein